MNTYFTFNQVFILSIITIIYLVSVYLYSYKKNIRIALFFLVIGGLVLRVFMATLDEYLHLWDEQIHALVAKNLSDNFLEPKLFKNHILSYNISDWSSNYIWLHKQPLFLWQIALSIKIFGATIFAVRFPSVIMSTILIWIIFKIGKQLVNERVGYLSALFFSVMGFFLDFISGYESTDHNDVAFLFYVTLSIWAFVMYKTTEVRKYIWLIGVFAGLAILNKWLVGLLVFSGWGISFLFIKEKEKKWNDFKNLLLSLSTCIVVFLPWQIYVHIMYPIESKIEYGLNTKHFFEVVEGHSGNTWFYFNQLKDCFGIIGAFILPLAIILFISEIKNKSIRISIIAYIIIVYVFFTISATKMVAFTSIIYPIFFISLGYLFYIISEKYNPLKTKWINNMVVFLSLITIVFLFIDVEQIQERHTDWKKSSSRYFVKTTKTRAKNFALRIKGKYEKEKTIFFNSTNLDNISIMFFSDYIVYERLPTELELKKLKKEHYKIVIIDFFSKIPAYIKEDDSIILESFFNTPIKITLSTFDGNFVYYDEHNNNFLTVQKDEQKLNYLNLIELEKNKIALQFSNNKFAAVEIQQDLEVLANRNEIGSWEIFELIPLNDNYVALKAVNNKYFSVSHSNLIYANSKTIGINEQFRIIKQN